MFNPLFASMNEVLDEIIADYASATYAQRAEMDEKLRILRGMSDVCIEQWLLFEEKMGKYLQHRTEEHEVEKQAPDVELSGKHSELFQRGQGYYKLNMYDEAIREFEGIVRSEPDFLLARVYLGMSFLQKGDTSEAYRLFHLLIHISENAQMKAISYNAMGCIHMLRRNLEKAYEYFRKAYKSDPAVIEPLFSMGLCYEHKGKLEFMLE
ncbi:tetratricopeptide repeat protein [Paenibacillus thalictri]|uniref:Tetratricopeptide repeat protein n=1 Tax=Paenibacillus thalictri TaxID=2527873 RepID=A0A4Q9DTN8_9BACL|nr:tetratricopeptide repeat protein [Paenibacillus thalictri]TBL79706.1 tetratricopeptide repeat protein [Paenibacillus thalictri]